MDSLLKWAGSGRYTGAMYRDNAPVAATTGHALVVRGVDSVERGAAVVEASEPRGDIPPARQCARLLREASAASTRPGVSVSLDTLPDAALRERAEQDCRKYLAEAQDSLAYRETRLAADLERPVRGSRAGLREAVQAAKNRVRDAEKRLRELDVATAHAVRSGEAVFDLRVVRGALRALRVRSGTLSAGHGPLDPGILVTATGIALVMPFRE
jgi:hypothetical protein